MRRLQLTVLAAVCGAASLAISACGGGSRSLNPAAPSPVAAAPGSTVAAAPTPAPAPPHPDPGQGQAQGATISGSVLGAGTGSAVRGAAGNLTVTVEGTSVSALVDDSGRFELRGVPEGDARLHFVGSSADASLVIAAVQKDESITVTVSVAGSRAEVVTLVRGGVAGETRLEGRVESVSATARSFVVSGRTVQVSDATRIEQAGQTRGFDAIRAGQQVEARGTLQGGTLAAAKVEINSAADAPVPVPIPQPPQPQEASARGVVASLRGSCPTLQFVVGGQSVTTDAATAFLRTTCGAVQNGTNVEVEGGRDASGAIRARKVQAEDAPHAAGEVEFTDTLRAIGGSAPALSLTVGTRTVRTSSATEVRRSGQTVGLGALVINQRLQVKGTAQNDGSVLAARITIEDEASQGAELEFTDTLRAIGGSVPALSLTVGTRTVRTSSATEVRRSGQTVGLGALLINQRLQVKGTAQGDGSVLATRITIEDGGPGPGDKEVEFTDVVTAIRGNAPALTLTIAGRTVVTNANTLVRRKGNQVPFTLLAVGQRVQVKGTPQTDATILAARLTIED